MMGSVRPEQRRRANTAKAAGFTIIETMIVLAVTGVLFVAIMSTISHQQNKVQFNQAINQIKGQLEQVINEVQSGQYPSAGNFTCVESATPWITGAYLDFPSSTSSQGTNADCMFIGKVVQFGSGLGSDPERYIVHSVAGLRNATDLSSSKAATAPPLTESRVLTNGLTTAWIRYKYIAPNGVTFDAQAGAVGFLTLEQHFGSASDGVVDANMQLVPIFGSRLDNPDAQSINANMLNSYQDLVGGVSICFKSGSTQQSGLITLGGKSGTSAVTLDIKQSTDCS